MTLRGSGKHCQHWKMWSLSELIGWQCDHKKSAPVRGAPAKESISRMAPEWLKKLREDAEACHD